MTRQRIDKLLVEKGLVPTRQKAQALIMAGNVLVDEVAVTKAGTQVNEETTIRLKDVNPFVSRGGIKLDGALTTLGVEVTGRKVLDVGASTGGFTDCCLKRGATHVVAIDVGTNQLDYRLRTDDRVECREQTNARDMTPDMFDHLASLAVIDVSFISITKLLEAVYRCTAADAEIVAMVKPQFEVGREKVGKGGVVRNDDDRQWAVDKVVEFAVTLGLSHAGSCDSSIAGPKGNREIFVLLKKEPPTCES